ncbi:ribonuclease kappa-like [Diadema setosum]|uniref:ribonuclease kappa-like n=1 Tax=Diadema setosum TaxID=31175 RepID=UPI003B3B5154
MVKVCGPKCSTCCSLLSIWGVVMLVLMGVFFRINALAFVEDISLPDVAELTKEDLEHSYTQVSNNCFIAAGIYVLFAAFSIYQYKVNKSRQYQVD